jgi:hypothetical protein
MGIKIDARHGIFINSAGIYFSFSAKELTISSHKFLCPGIKPV